jgi:hypothetical protein
MKMRTSIADAHLLDEFRDRLAAARLRLARMVATTDEDLETLAGGPWPRPGRTAANCC